VFVVLFFHFKNILKTLVLGIVLATVVLSFAYSHNPVFKSKVNSGTHGVIKAYEKNDFNSSTGMRVAAWIISYEIITKNPIFGVGDSMEEFRNTIDSTHQHLKLIRWFPHLHSEYLEVIVRYGIVGLVLFMMIFYHSSKIKIEDRAISNIKISLLTLFAIACLVDPFLDKRYTMSLFAFFLGVVLSQSRHEHNNFG
jgi:O-antigen ligase